MPVFAGIVLLADSLLAIGFAWCLTGALLALPQRRAAAMWLIGLALAAGLRGVALWASTALAAERARRVKRHWRGRLLDVLLHARAAAAPLAGTAAAAVVDEIEALDPYLIRYAPARLNAALGPLLVLAAAASASLVGAGLLAATLVPFVALMILAGGAAAGASRRQFDALARLSGLFADRVRALPLLLAFQAEAATTARIGAAAREMSARTLSVLRIAFISTAGLEFFAALSVALVAVYAGFSLLGLLPFALPGRVEFGNGFFVLALAPEFYAPMRRLAAAYHDKQLGEAAAERLEAVLRTPVAPTPLTKPISTAPPILFRAAIAGAGPDLRIGPLDFTVPAGGIAVLMGPTGAGKTTLLRLLVGEAPLCGGDVEIGDQRLSEVGSFAPLIGWAGQAPILLPGTIGANIALAAPDAPRARVLEVAEQAGLGPMLAARPDGLETMLDERGSGMSGGERRRIGLARALLKPAPILLLDEPTADLDPAAQTAMIELLTRAAVGRTVLIATHSEAVAAIAGQVVRL